MRGRKLALTGRRCARDDAYTSQGERAAVWATQVPGLRGLDFGPQDDWSGEEGLDEKAAIFRARVHPAEVAHAMKSRREDMLEVSAHELDCGEGALPRLLGMGVGIAETHVLVIGLENALVGDRSTADIAGEIFDDVFSRACRLPMDPPPVVPDRLGDLRMQVRGACAKLLVEAYSEKRLDGSTADTNPIISGQSFATIYRATRRACEQKSTVPVKLPEESLVVFPNDAAGWRRIFARC